MRPATRGALDAVTAVGGAMLAMAESVPDLHKALALELRIAPLLGLVSVLTAFGADAALPLALGWLAASLLNTAARCLLARHHGNPKNRPLPSPWPARLYGLSWMVELLLWGLWLGAAVPPSLLVQGWLGAGAAALLLLAALTAARWPLLWNAWIGGWALVAAAIVLRAGLAGLSALLFGTAAAAWLGAVWWFGRSQPQGSTLPVAPRRSDWKAVVQAVPTPLLVLRGERVAAANAAAARLLGVAPPDLAGRRFDELLQAEPAYVLDPLTGDRSVRGLRVAPLAPAGDAGERPTWPARARVLSPGRADSAVMLALLPQAGSADDFAEDARRLISWFALRGAQPWYRDEQGCVVLPPNFDSAQPVGAAASAFPLAPWLLPTERAVVEADYLRALAQGRVFERIAHLVDRDGRLRRLRITCLTRAPAGAAAIGDRLPAIGLLAPVAYGGDADGRGALAEWSSALPMFVWWVDAAGTIERVHGSDGWRWGLQCADDAGGQRWDDALRFDGDGRAAVLGALRQALAGTPSFDVLNLRVTRRGAKLALRSHFVPFAGRDGQAGVLVTDTIAAPGQLSEIDRLRRARNHYKELAESSTNLIWACNADLVFTYVSRRAAREIYGCEQADLMGRSLLSLLADPPQHAARAALEGLRAGQALRSFEMIQRGRDGARVIVAVDAVPLVASDGAFAGAIGVHTDLTTLKQREQRLVEALRIERTVLDAAGQAIAVVRGERVARCNEAFLRLLQVAPAVLLKMPVEGFFADPSAWPALAAAADAGSAQDVAASCELQVQRGGRAAGGAVKWCQITARWIAAGEYVLVLADIDQIRHREALALHHANHDELTGLPNRRLLAARGQQALAADGRCVPPCAVLAIDLDGFKEVNDVHGHDCGDRVLRAVADRLANLLRPQDTVARRGGDEFTMLLPGVADRAGLERIAQRLLTALAQPVDLGNGTVVQLSASVGIALAPEHGQEFDRLLQLADLAMYEAKLKGKNGYAFALPPAPGADPADGVRTPA